MFQRQEVNTIYEYNGSTIENDDFVVDGVLFMRILGGYGALPLADRNNIVSVKPHSHLFSFNLLNTILNALKGTSSLVAPLQLYTN